MGDAIIKVEGLGKCYSIGVGSEQEYRYTALRDIISQNSRRFVGNVRKLLAGAQLDRPAKKQKEFWALRDVSFKIGHGQAVGIIGRNGAGKSTLLKVLSRITEPTRGRIEINGRIASLLEVGTGFHPELTGRENIYLNGAVLGMSRQEIKRKFDEIVSFSDVEAFLDTPVKRYSSGMYVRLAFAVAAHLEPEILVVDEVLAVGDTEFQKKCLGKMDQVSKEGGRTVLFVSHQMGMLSQLCNHSLLLQQGKVVMMDDTAKVIGAYLKGSDYANIYIADIEKSKNKTAFIAMQRVTNAEGEAVSQITTAHPIVLEVTVAINKWEPGLELSLSLQNKSKGRIFTVNRMVKEFMQPHEKEKTIRFVVPANTITPNHYSWLNSLHIPGFDSTIVDVLWDESGFNIIDAGTEFARYEGQDYGAVMLKEYDFNIVEE